MPRQPFRVEQRVAPDVDDDAQPVARAARRPGLREPLALADAQRHALARRTADEDADAALAPQVRRVPIDVLRRRRAGGVELRHDGGPLAREGLGVAVRGICGVVKQ